MISDACFEYRDNRDHETFAEDLRYYLSDPTFYQTYTNDVRARCLWILQNPNDASVLEQVEILLTDLFA